jgi:tRNA G18 (ribose-2'-O)-methylase SpoU
VPVVDVSSPLDPRLVLYRSVSDPALAERHGLFVAEGRRVVERAIRSGLSLRSILLTATAQRAMADLLDSRPDVAVLRVSQALMNDVIGFNIHRGCLALAERPAHRDWAALTAGARLVVVLEGIGDADNVGSIFRTASAFGVDAVLMDPTCADPLYRKAVRTSMAATIAVPFAAARPWPDVLRMLGTTGWRVLGLTPRGDAPPLQHVAHTDADTPTALVFGHEGSGLSEETLAACTAHARIPMAAGHDSLNVAVSVAVALYELTRDQAERQES